MLRAMQQCTYTTFITALRNPNALLRSLRGVVIEVGTEQHTKHFGECHATKDGRGITLYAPISPEAMTLANNAASIISAANGELGNFDIITEELLCSNPIPSYCSVIVEDRASGIPLREALYTHTKSNLLRGMKRLREVLRLHDVSHNHLTLDNIVVDATHTWHTTHNYYMSRGAGGDDNIFSRIASLIDERALPDNMELHDVYAPYTTMRGYPLVCHRRRVITPEGIGFEDDSGNIVIEGKYLRATDFNENRAIVVTHEFKTGIIDRDGRNVIAPIYDDIEYDTIEGTSRVRLGNRYAIFDYNGEQMTEWSDN